jgi:hypothetical protein
MATGGDIKGRQVLVEGKRSDLIDIIGRGGKSEFLYNNKHY